MQSGTQVIVYQCNLHPENELNLCLRLPSNNIIGSAIPHHYTLIIVFSGQWGKKKPRKNHIDPSYSGPPVKKTNTGQVNRLYYRVCCINEHDEETVVSLCKCNNSVDDDDCTVYDECTSTRVDESYVEIA